MLHLKVEKFTKKTLASMYGKFKRNDVKEMKEIKKKN